MKPLLKWLVPVLAVVLLVVAGAGILQARKARQARNDAAAAAPKAEAVVELAPTDVVKVRRIELVEGLAISGTLKAVDSALLKARVAGELRDLQLREGDPVEAGQIVARIDPTEYRLRQQQAQRLADASKAQVDIAQRAYDNNRALVDKGFISRTALDTSLANLNAAKANFAASVAAADVAARSVADTAIRSPIAGRIAQRMVQNGERVGIDTRIAEVLDLSRIELASAIPAAESARVRIGLSATIRVEGGADLFRAEVVRINPSAQEASRTVPVYLRLDRHEGLRQGLFAQGSLEIGRASVLALPREAVRTDRPKPYVQVLAGDRIAHREVLPGLRGLVEGTEMVGIEGLPEGTRGCWSVRSARCAKARRPGWRARWPATEPGLPRCGSPASVSPTRSSRR